MASEGSPLQAVEFQCTSDTSCAIPLLPAIGSGKNEVDARHLEEQRPRDVDEDLVGFDPLAPRWWKGKKFFRPAVGSDDEEHSV